jgi:amidase
MKTIVDVMLAIDPSFDANRARRDVSNARVGMLQVEADGEIVSGVASAISRTSLATHDVRLASMKEAFTAGLAVINAETWRAFGHLVESGKLGADIDARLRAASKTTPADLEAAERVRREFTEQVDAALNEVEVLVLPTMPSFPIALDAARAGASVIAMSSLIRPFNLSGHPALTLPVAVEGSALKAGLQIVGRKGDDETVCAVAAHIEAMLAG